MQQITIEQVLNWSCQLIDRVDARVLLQYILHVNHAYLLTHPEEVLVEERSEAFNKLVMQRVQGMPIAYLTGECAFYDLTFKVSPAVLIPRPETELLIELALARIPSDRSYQILDLGTGSGAIAITLAKHCPQAEVVAVDLSADAVSIASMNTKNLGVDNVCFVRGNWFDGLVGKKFDMIVSNPPYVAEGDPHLKQGDLRFEPQMALTASDNGLASLSKITAHAPAYLVAGGWLLLEHGYDQAAVCRQLLANTDFSNISSYTDLAGIMRVSGGQFNGSPRTNCWDTAI